MRAFILILKLCLIASVPTQAFAQSEQGVLSQLLDPAAPARTVITKWQNAFETFCRGEKETYEAYQTRLNQRMQALGTQGWELVGLVSTPIQGKDCLAFGYKRATPR